jgi:acetyl-CoA C-acetyltransferase
MIMKRIWILSAKRTPQGRFLGGLAKYSAVETGVEAGKAALGNLDPTLIDLVLGGNVLGAGLGMNVVRQIGVGVRLPFAIPAFTVNMMCASGMQAVILAVQAIQYGSARMVLCGGTESMSNAPFLLGRARAGYKLGNGVLIDSVLRDGLVDSFSGEHMGLTAERVAERFNILGEVQDRFAVRSQQRYAAANAAGHFREEIVPVGKLKQDEHPRPDTTMETLATLCPVFNPTGTVTAGNASSLNDGAAMLVVCDEERGRECGLNPLIIASSRTVGCEPSLMGLGPVFAARKISKDPGEFDVIELNEAFAAQCIACVQELGLNEEKVNPDGGAIALGHPIGASGARLLVHLAHRRPRRGLATLCVGGGMGRAMLLQRP